MKALTRPLYRRQATAACGHVVSIAIDDLHSHRDPLDYACDACIPSDVAADHRRESHLLKLLNARHAKDGDS